MKNGRGSADRLTLVAPAGGVVSGRLYAMGSMVVMAEGSADEGEPFSAVTRYEFGYAKVAGTAASLGDVAHFDPAANVITPTAASGVIPVGVFTAAAADSDTECLFALTGERTSAIA